MTTPVQAKPFKFRHALETPGGLVFELSFRGIRLGTARKLEPLQKKLNDPNVDDLDKLDALASLLSVITDLSEEQALDIHEDDLEPLMGRVSDFFTERGQTKRGSPSSDKAGQSSMSSDSTEPPTPIPAAPPA